MAKKLVEAITSMEEDFAQWYTDVVKKAELCGYTSVKGCMAIKPAGYAIWENIQHELDRRFKETGVQNVYMPMFIPESLLQKEKDHVEGFAPEVAWVTHGGLNELQERLCVRPTSETLFCDFYQKDIQSHRDLPKVYNQWCSVVRWEKTTRPFLRSREFLWQEGHTAHATAEEAEERTIQMLNLYADFCEEVLAIPVIKGQKTDKEKFAGAVATYTIESLMHDGKALQSGTSHNFGDGFAKAFGIQYTDKDNTLKYVHQTSWGMTTRMIGAIIMVHGDNSGLVLPPRIAPTQAVIIPIQQRKEGVLEKADELFAALKAAGIRVKVDDTDRSPGFKFAEQEMRGIPIRIECGPKDIENGQAVICRRDTREKYVVSFDELASKVQEVLDLMQKEMLERARAHRDAHTYVATNYEEFKDTINNKPGFVKAMWCGDRECEDKIKEDVQATSRCMPFEQEHLSDVCVCCGKPAKKMVYWEEHTNMKLTIPSNAEKILHILEENGYEAYVVGGCVRDSILGRTPDDWDITTSASPEQVKELFHRTVDTGLQHGTVTVLMDKEGYEVTTYRVDGDYEDGRHPKQVMFTSSLEEDLKRRDFTINAMAYHPVRGLVDLFHGMEDMQAKIIRCVGDPMERFHEDALRILRAVRFSAQLGFTIEKETKSGIRALAPNLKCVSAERIQTELVKLLASPHPDYLRVAYETGITKEFLPEFDRCMETEQNTPHHCYTVGEHILNSMMLIRPDKVLRLTMLLHDIAKPVMRKTDENGRDHFKMHATEGEKMAKTILRRLKFDNDTISKVTRLIRYHDDRPMPEMRSVRHAVNRIGEELFPLYLEVQEADMLAQSEYHREEKAARLQGVTECYHRVLEQKQCVSLKTLAVTGRDLISAGYKPGPELGEILKKMLDHVLEYPQDNDREKLLALLKER